MRAALVLAVAAVLVGVGPVPAVGARQATTLTVEGSDPARHGEPHEITIVLTAGGTPLTGEMVALFEELHFFDYVDTVLVSEVRTDFRGTATVTHIPSAPGPGRVTVHYPGSDAFAPADASMPFAVVEGTPLVTPVIPVPSPPLLPRGITAAWFIPLLIGVWVALGSAVYNLVRIPFERPAPREQV
jgi:hypothetical protein